MSYHTQDAETGSSRGDVPIQTIGWLAVAWTVPDRQTFRSSS